MKESIQERSMEVVSGSRSAPPSRGTSAGFALVYCDYIAHQIKNALLRDAALEWPQGKVASVGGPKYDLHPTEGYLLTSKKTLPVTDRNGTRYRITVEEETDSRSGGKDNAL